VIKHHPSLKINLAGTGEAATTVCIMVH